MMIVMESGDTPQPVNIEPKKIDNDYQVGIEIGNTGLSVYLEPDKKREGDMLMFFNYYPEGRGDSLPKYRVKDAALFGWGLYSLYTQFNTADREFLGTPKEKVGSLNAWTGDLAVGVRSMFKRHGHEDLISSESTERSDMEIDWQKFSALPEEDELIQTLKSFELRAKRMSIKTPSIVQG
jgi:hypothetical protein